MPDDPRVEVFHKEIRRRTKRSDGRRTGTSAFATKIWHQLSQVRGTIRQGDPIGPAAVERGDYSALAQVPSGWAGLFLLLPTCSFAFLARLTVSNQRSQLGR